MIYFKKTLIFSFFLCSFVASANEQEVCSIKTTSKVYHFGEKTPSALELHKHSSCSPQILRQFHNILKSSKGLVLSSSLTKVINDDLNLDQKITITPERIRAYDLNQLIIQQYGLNSNISLEDYRLIDKGNLLLEPDELIELKCEDCQKLGEKNIELSIIKTSSGEYKKRWLKAKTVKQITALTPIRTLRVHHKSLNAEELKEIKIKTDSPSDYFANFSEIKFYRLNKPLEPGTPIRYSDLSALNIVKVGTPAKVILNSKNLTLSHQASPLRSGKIGDSIQLRAKNSNKTITGKVIDFNKVQIQL